MQWRSKVTVALAFAVRLWCDFPRPSEELCRILTSQSVIIPVVFRLQAIRDQPCATRVRETDIVAILTIITLHVSIMSATFVCMKQFLNALDSGMIREHSTNSKSIAMGTMRSKSSARTSKLIKSVDLPSRRFSMMSKGNGKTGLKSGRHEDNDSMNSDGSDRAIITKTREWEVRYDKADTALQPGIPRYSPAP